MPDRRHADPLPRQALRQTRESGLSVDAISERTGLARRTRTAAACPGHEEERHHFPFRDPGAMKPAAERKAKLADELSKAGTADEIASAIVNSIDQASRESGAPESARQVRRLSRRTSDDPLYLAPYSAAPLFRRAGRWALSTSSVSPRWLPIPMADLKRLLGFNRPLLQNSPKDWCNGERGWRSHRSRRRGKSIKLLQRGKHRRPPLQGRQNLRPSRSCNIERRPSLDLPLPLRRITAGQKNAEHDAAMEFASPLDETAAGRPVACRRHRSLSQRTEQRSDRGTLE